MKVWCENEEAPKHLLQRVLIKGAKKQCNFLTVTSPTTCLTSEWQFTLTDGVNDLLLFLLEPALPSNTPFSKIRLCCLQYSRNLCSHYSTVIQGPRSVDTTVFFYVKPKLADLSNELGDLTWSEIKSLAVQLEIDYNELLKIEEQTNQATDRMHRALNIWLEKDPNASWEKVINALDRVKGKDVLIQKLKEKYLPPQSPGNLYRVIV